MPEREDRIAVRAEWVVKAENDLTNGAHVLKLGESCPTDTVCFHAQQCVEKHLKAILVLKGTDFPKAHDLEMLVALVPARLRPGLARLTEYATGARYPGWEEISLAEARRAVALARRVRRAVRRALPRAAVRRRKD